MGKGSPLSIPMTSAPRVERVDDLVVDSQGLDPPTEKWLQAAREAADTDGIRENAYAERLQMCISCCTLMCMFPMVPNMYRVSHSRYVSERVSPSYSTTGIGPFYKNMESLPVAPVPPKSLPRHSRGTPEQLPSSCRAAAEQLPSSLPLAARENPFSGTFWNLQKTGFEPSTPSREPGAKPTRQPCWACYIGSTGDAHMHSRTHGRSGKPSVPPKTKNVELVEHIPAVPPSRARTDGNHLQIPRQICRGASLYIGSTTVGMHIYALADPW